MSRNKAIWLARLLFRRGQLTRDEILAAWGRCDESARPMAQSTFYDNRHLLEERYGIKLRNEFGYYSLDLRDSREHDFVQQLFRNADDEIPTPPDATPNTTHTKSGNADATRNTTNAVCISANAVCTSADVTCEATDMPCNTADAACTSADVACEATDMPCNTTDASCNATDVAENAVDATSSHSAASSKTTDEKYATRDVSSATIDGGLVSTDAISHKTSMASNISSTRAAGSAATSHTSDKASAGSADERDRSAHYIDEPLPAGYCHVATLAAAVERRLWTEMTYAPFDKEGYTTDFAPYCLRTFRGRCYVVGLSARHGEIRNFALDRITALRTTTRTFRSDASFSARKYFANSFGTYGGMHLAADHIVIEAAPRAAAYLRSRPLHDTQRETTAKVATTKAKASAIPQSDLSTKADTSATRDNTSATSHSATGVKAKAATTNDDSKTTNDNGTSMNAGNASAPCAYPFRFELDIALSADFVRELLYYGSEIHVVSPAALRDMLKAAAKEIGSLY